MITLFTSTKAFRGESAVHQRNALESWRALHPEVEILLFGDEEGTGAVAQELGLRHLPRVAENQWGTPLLSDMFEQAGRVATHDLICYINADIILLKSFIIALEGVGGWSTPFVAVGRRWDLTCDDPIAIEPGWEEQLGARCKREGELSHPTALDFFAFPRGTFDQIPPFAIGRPAWDAWMVANTLRRRIPLVDLTYGTTVIHQNHGYGHMQEARGQRWEGPEADINRALAKRHQRRFDPGFFSVLSATHLLQGGAILPARMEEYTAWRRRVTYLRLPLWLRRLLLLLTGRGE